MCVCVCIGRKKPVLFIHHIAGIILVVAVYLLSFVRWLLLLCHGQFCQCQWSCSVLQRHRITITTVSKNILLPTVSYQSSLFQCFLTQTGVKEGRPRCCRLLGLVCYHGERSDRWLVKTAVLQQAEMGLVWFPEKLLVLAFFINGCLETKRKLLLSFKPWLHMGNWFWSSRPERRLKAPKHDIFLKGHF